MPIQSTTQRVKHGQKATPKRAQPSADIPDKLYFRIGEVARLCAIETYVLRFWETEFPQLRPAKGGTGQRLYRKRDVETALRIRTLLYEEGFTIPGARQALLSELRSHKRDPELQLELTEVPSQNPGMKLQKVRTELREILGMLSCPPGRPHSAKPHQAKPHLVKKESRTCQTPPLF